jgi:hypothetical protein
MTDPIKAKIQELLPDMVPNAKYIGMPTITLAVVLRAINKQGFNNREHHERILYALCNGMNAVNNTETKSNIGWNLEHDNYDQQSEECKQFIGSLLGV